MNTLKNFIYEEDGLGTIEIAIIIAALVALAIVFKKQLADIWGKIAGGLSEKTDDATDTSDFKQYRTENGNTQYYDEKTNQWVNVPK